jgi:hypothetical protein
MGINRRKMLIASFGGIALAMPGLSAIYRWMDSKKIKITVAGPFQQRSYNSSELPIKVSNKPDWFSVDSITIGFNTLEPSADLTLALCSALDFPKKPVQINGRIIGKLDKTLARAAESYDVSGILGREVNLGIVTAKIVPTIEHYIYYASKVQLKDISRIEWEIYC